jgi:hypothetical protein
MVPPAPLIAPDAIEEDTPPDDTSGIRPLKAAYRSKHTCAFIGPSLAGSQFPATATLFPPATRGSIAAAIGRGYRRIAIIDGAVGPDAVPLQEMRRALSDPDVEVVGGASLGAVRAAQLDSGGMRGIGRIYRLFRRGALTSPEEVYVLHAPAALRYRCLTLPLVNVRFTLRAMRRLGHIDAGEERQVLAQLAEVPWFDRDRQSLSAAISAACTARRSAVTLQRFEALYRDVKRSDALLVLAKLRE